MLKLRSHSAGPVQTRRANLSTHPNPRSRLAFFVLRSRSAIDLLVSPIAVPLSDTTKAGIFPNKQKQNKQGKTKAV